MTLEALMAARIDNPLPEEAAEAVERQIRRRQAAAGGPPQPLQPCPRLPER